MTVSPVRLAAPRVFLKLHDLVVDVPVFVHRLGYEFLFKRLAVPIKPSLLQMPVVHVVVRLPGLVQGIKGDELARQTVKGDVY